MARLAHARAPLRVEEKLDKANDVKLKMMSPSHSTVFVQDNPLVCLPHKMCLNFPSPTTTRYMLPPLLSAVRTQRSLPDSGKTRPYQPSTTRNNLPCVSTPCWGILWVSALF